MSTSFNKKILCTNLTCHYSVKLFKSYLLSSKVEQSELNTVIAIYFILVFLHIYNELVIYL